MVDAYLVRIWSGLVESLMSYRANGLKIGTDRRTDRQTDGQTPLIAIPLRPVGRGVKIIHHDFEDKNIC